MLKQKVTILKPYPFQMGQKIRIEGSRREGNWEVIEISANKVTLLYPASHKEFTWDFFCYFVEEKKIPPGPWKNEIKEKGSAGTLFVLYLG